MTDTVSPTTLAAALAAWRGLLGAAGCLSAEALGPGETTATFPWPGAPLARLVPATPDQAADCLAVASTHGVPIHPVARGRSWGLGSRLPPSAAVILDLSRLDRIIALDMRHGMVRLEPGVTFAALQRRLRDEGLAFHVPSFGGSPDASVLANALERGDGLGTHGDRYLALRDLDVALASGERLRTGPARFGVAPDALAVDPRPAGPVLEGLFSQSGLGVVLAATMTLQPTPAFAEAVLIDIPASDALGPALTALGALIRDGIVDPMAATLWDAAKRQSAGAGGAGWGLSLMLGAPDRGFLAARRRRVIAALGPFAAEVTVQGDRDADGRRRDTFLTGLSDGANLAAVHAGRPAGAPRSGNPDADGCGFVWLCPALPLDGAAVAAVADAVAAETRTAPVVAALGFQAQSSQTLHGYVSLAWDRARPGADAEAMAAHDRLAARLLALNMAPFRRGWAGLRAQPITDGTMCAILARLRGTLDPSGVLSPGRLT